ncbi:hypothetical protein B0H16DRAFT_1452789 [Mycena metata]|uniref:Uncharacterized protein n=1 Tax=Mycena metata TaxID=1033252 RepID=A0AAD7JPV8_9AGAR|nr:hypothetical protein B0H16DRAFT_1452789 [Mycena metata]
MTDGVTSRKVVVGRGLVTKGIRNEEVDTGRGAGMAGLSGWRPGGGPAYCTEAVGVLALGASEGVFWSPQSGASCPNAVERRQSDDQTPFAIAINVKLACPGFTSVWRILNTSGAKNSPNQGGQKSQTASMKTNNRSFWLNITSNGIREYFRTWEHQVSRVPGRPSRDLRLGIPRIGARKKLELFSNVLHATDEPDPVGREITVPGYCEGRGSKGLRTKTGREAIPGKYVNFDCHNKAYSSRQGEIPQDMHPVLVNHESLHKVVRARAGTSSKESPQRFLCPNKQARPKWAKWSLQQK